MPLILLISMSAFLIPLSVRWPLPIKHAFHHLMILEVFCYIRSQFTGRLLYIFQFDVSCLQILLDQFSTVVKFIRYHVSKSVSLGYSLLLRWNTMAKSNIGRKEFICLTHPESQSTEENLGRDLKWAGSGPNHGGVLLPGLLLVVCSASFMIDPKTTSPLVLWSQWDGSPITNH